MRDITTTGSAVKTVAALGLFDGVHLGHREVIKATVAEAARLRVSPCVFSFDSMTVSTKSGTLMTEEEKRRRLEALGVRLVFSPDFSKLRDMSAEEFADEILAKRLSCVCVVCGENFRFGKNAEGNSEKLKELCRRRGIRTVIVPPLKLNGETVSTTAVKALLEAGNAERANALLGEPMGYTLPVTHGKALGRRLGFPTVNQLLQQGLTLPRFGVYCSEVSFGGKRFAGVTNVGIKPTVEKEGTPSLETYIIGFDKDVYGKTLTTSLLSFLRPEKRFESVEALKRQIAEDKRSALDYFKLTV